MRTSRVIAVAAALPLLASCTLNAGDATAAEFDDWVADHPIDGVTVAVTSSQNVLPGAGEVDVAAKVTGDDIPAAIAAAGELCDFEPPSGSRIAFQLEARRLEAPYPCDDPDRTVEQFTALWRAADDNPDVVGIEGGIGGVEVGTTSAEAVRRSLPVLVAQFRASAGLYAGAGSELAFSGGRQTVTLDLGWSIGADDAEWPTPGVLEAVDATLAALAGRPAAMDVAEGLVTVRVPGSDARATALRARIQEILPSANDTVRVVSGSSG